MSTHRLPKLEIKPVVGYEGLYEISNSGQVRGIKRNGILKQHVNHKGYRMVGLTKWNVKKRYTTHRLVAIAFIPNPENKPQKHRQAKLGRA